VNDSSNLGRRAVIIGGSLAGLLSARAVADHYEEVVVLERDKLSDTPGPRMSTPQSFHLHVLLKGGENAMDRLAPGFRDAIETSGAETLNPGREFASASDLGEAKRFDSPMRLHGQSRWLVEDCLRRRVVALTDNLTMREGVTVRGLRHDPETNRITAVHMESDDGLEELAADLVVDASGRGEGGVRWLTALGLEVPEIDTVKVDFAYASTFVRLADDPERDWKGLLVGNLPREGARGAVLMPIEGGLHVCSAGGRAGDYPPDDEPGFIEFIRSLPDPRMAEELERAEFVRPISRMIYPANRLRHYETCASLPAAFLPVGDAFCSFNPTYGQGMSCAALQAEALADTLSGRAPEEDITSLGPRYLERAVQAVEFPWRNANFHDFLYPTTEGDRSMVPQEESGYRIQLQAAAARDPVLRDLSAAVQHLLEPYERLFEPDVRARVEAAMSANDGSAVN
jgi:2-polyprenyl-6-methoxyphenol hydroxylase-like FAD-dependent oxidoreductase